MSDQVKDAAAAAVTTISEAAGFRLSTSELELIGEAVVGLVHVLASSAGKRAEQAGQAAAAKIVTDQDARRELAK